jgi:protease I
MKKTSFILLLLAVCAWPFNTWAQDAVIGKKTVVMVIAQNEFRDDEFFLPKEILEKNGIEVKVASTSLAEALGSLGGVYKPELLLKDVKADDFHAIVFVGGIGATQYLDDPLAHKLARDFLNSNKIVSAICIGPVILAKAGILKGKQATVIAPEADKLKEAGAVYTAKAVEKDGNIITADGPGAAKEFAEALVKALKK